LLVTCLSKIFPKFYVYYRVHKSPLLVCTLSQVNEQCHTSKFIINHIYTYV
jgi:hypothetical protein